MTVARPQDLGVPPTAAMPQGMSVVLDPTTKQLADDVLFGGAPPRLLRLSGTGVEALAELRSGPVRSSAAASLARRLTDAGLAHPVPAPSRADLDLTVVVPVRDRPADLVACLDGLGSAYPVVVVDDGSVDPDGVRSICDAHGAQLICRPVAGGPAAARNTGLAAVRTDLVAFVDSDCRTTPGWLGGLAGHLADPLVVAVAPRVAPAGPSLLGSPLDLGGRPAGVVPMTRVAYLPTAALLVRRLALGDGFDESFRYGEDVDLVWKLLDAGWRLRYEPAVQVTHREPTATGALLRRRFNYGTSAAPLARRHPGHLTHLVVAPAPSAAVAGLVAGRPTVAAAAFATGTARLAGRLRPFRVPLATTVRSSAAGTWQTWVGFGRWTQQFALPAAAVVAALPGRRRRRRQLAVAALLLAPPLAGWWHRRGGLLRYVGTSLVDQTVYGAGVYTGCWRHRVLAPLLPTVAGRRGSGSGDPDPQPGD